MGPRKLFVWLAAFGLGLAGPGALAGEGAWPRYVSKNALFTIETPPGWKVTESWDEKNSQWSCQAVDPTGTYLAKTDRLAAPEGTDGRELANRVLAKWLDLLRKTPGIQLAPQAMMNETAKARVTRFGGGYVDARGRRKEFRNLVFGQMDSVMCRSIEALEGELDGPTGQMLGKILGSLKSPQVRQEIELVERTLASGWAKFQAPPDWKVVDLQDGHCIVTDPTDRLAFISGANSFISPKYYRPIMGNRLIADYCPPFQALALACTKLGFGSDFRCLGRRPTPDDQVAKQMAGPLRAACVEDFAYTFTYKGVPYVGVSTGGTFTDAMRTGCTLWHFSIWAPAADIKAAWPVLTAILSSYELNGQKAGARIQTNMENYARGLRALSAMIAKNADDMRRESLEAHLARSRAKEYQIWQTSNMILDRDPHYNDGSGWKPIDNQKLFERLRPYLH
jgi:hypothetical protein